MLKPTFCLIVYLFFINLQASFACGNEYYSTPDLPYVKGKLELKSIIHSKGDMTYPYWQHGFGENIWDKRYDLSIKIDPSSNDGSLNWASIEKALKKNIDYKLLSDYAWYELRVGNKRNAVRLLEKLYEKHPNEYNIVANLGTAYEVTGNNQKALELLKKAVAINPASHYGSEWIHVNILEQKVKQSPDYSAILDLDASKNYSEWLTGNMYKKNIPADTLMVQLAYQLHERISFVNAPDPIVGHLVLDFADLVAITNSRKEAKDFYDYAVKYLPPLTKAVNGRLAASETTVIKSEPSGKQKNKKGNNVWIYGGSIVALIAIAWLLIRRRRKISLK